jgi:hypothetical protein
MTDEEITRTRQFAEGLDLLKLSFVGLGESIGKALIPAMGPMADFDDRLEELETHHVVLSKAFGNPGDTPQMEGAAANAGLPLEDFGLHMYKPPALEAGGGKKAKPNDAYDKWLEMVAKSTEAFEKATEESQDLMRKWEPVISPVMKAWDDYYERLKKITELSKDTDTSALQLQSVMKLGFDLDQGFDAKTGPGSQDSMGMFDELVPKIQAVTPVLKQARDQFATLDADAFEFGEKASGAFTQMIVLGRGFESSMRSLVDLFAQFILKAVVFQEISKAFGQGNSPVGMLGSFFAGLAGARAGGGDVNYGQSYLVGEQGPEVFTPTTSGMITPNDAMSSLGNGGRSGDTYHIDARGADAGVEYRVQRALAAVQKKATVNGYLMSQEMAKRGA